MAVNRYFVYFDLYFRFEIVGIYHADYTDELVCSPK